MHRRFIAALPCVASLLALCFSFLPFAFLSSLHWQKLRGMNTDGYGMLSEPHTSVCHEKKCGRKRRNFQPINFNIEEETETYHIIIQARRYSNLVGEDNEEQGSLNTICLFQHPLPDKK